MSTNNDLTKDTGNIWHPIDFEPKSAGSYLVSRLRTGQVNIARYAPRLGRWIFANANQSFDVTHWMQLPEPPK